MSAKPPSRQIRQLPYRILRKNWWVILIGVALLPIASLPLRLAFAAQRAPSPQAILILGGDPKREEEAAELAKYYANLKIWVSSGPDAAKSREIFRSAGIAPHRLYIDNRATDTVTNFTTIVGDLKALNIHHVYLITSDFHMDRAKAIAILVLGSQGITFTPVTTPSNRSKEQRRRIWRDVGRSLIWIYTGWSGEKPKRKLGGYLDTSPALVRNLNSFYEFVDLSETDCFTVCMISTSSDSPLA
jgi:uncharacterized SAM-binding protein YcdF (DUF218 family)